MSSGQLISVMIQRQIYSAPLNSVLWRLHCRESSKPFLQWNSVLLFWLKAILACAARGWGARSFSRYWLHQSRSNAGWHDDTGWVHHYIAYAIDMIIILQFSALLILAEAADIPKDVKRFFVAICLLYCVWTNFYTGRSLRSSKCPAFRIPSTFPRSKYISHLPLSSNLCGLPRYRNFGSNPLLVWHAWLGSWCWSPNFIFCLYGAKKSICQCVRHHGRSIDQSSSEYHPPKVPWLHTTYCPLSPVPCPRSSYSAFFWSFGWFRR